MGVKERSSSPGKANVSIISTAKYSGKKKSAGLNSSVVEESFSTPTKSVKTSKKSKVQESGKKSLSKDPINSVADESFTTPSKSIKTSKKSKSSGEKSLTKDVTISPKKSGKKSILVSEVLSSDDEVFEPKHKSKNNKKTDKKNDAVVEVNEEVEIVAGSWPTEDLNELFSQIECNLPKNDSLNFKTRAESLEWEKIAFKSYSPQECKTMWDNISKKLRSFRLMREVLEDAKVWSKKPWQDFHRKRKEHPEMPRKPLSTYMVYFKHTYEKLKKKYPNESLTELTKKISEKYRNLSEEKKQKFINISAQQRAAYDIEVEKFYEKYPDQRPEKVSKSKSNGKRRASEAEKPGSANPLPSKPVAPFRLFYEDRLKKEDSSNIDKVAFQARCREIWNKMSDAKKGVWINLSVEQEEIYKEGLQTYKSQNPDLESPSPTFKSCLTKDEVVIRDRLLGKPDKPPNSAYTLFSTMLLSSDELKTAAPKDRMLLISQQWRNLDPEEKKTYEDRVANLKETYKADYAEYLKSLSPEKRNLISQPDHKKGKKTKQTDDEAEVNKANENKKIKLDKKVEAMKTLFEGEPEAPPIHASLLFAKSYRGNPSTVQAAWKSLSAKTQNKYRRKLEELKQKYMVDYEFFLKNLDEDQLQEYSDVMKRRNGGKDISIDSSSSGSSESGSDLEDDVIKKEIIDIVQKSDDSDSDSSDDD